MHRRFDILGDSIHEMTTKQEQLESNVKFLSDILVESRTKPSMFSVSSHFSKEDLSTLHTLKHLE